MISLQLPYPPSVWKLYTGFGKNRHKSTEYIKWLAAAATEVVTAPYREPIAGKFSVTILAGRPDKRKRDIDNIIKPTLDLLQNHELIEDDCLAESITAAWSPDVEKRRIYVMVCPWRALRKDLVALPDEDME